MVGEARFELARLATPAPKAGASAVPPLAPGFTFAGSVLLDGDLLHKASGAYNLPVLSHSASRPTSRLTDHHRESDSSRRSHHREYARLLDPYLRAEGRRERTIFAYQNSLRPARRLPCRSRQAARAARHPTRAPRGLDRVHAARQRSRTVSFAFRSVRPSSSGRSRKTRSTAIRWTVDGQGIGDQLRTGTRSSDCSVPVFGA
jgi:hypothetical protein